MSNNDSVAAAIPHGRLLRRLALGLFVMCAAAAMKVPSDWQREWPRTDFSNRSVELSEIADGGPSKDGIPAIDGPEFLSIDGAYPIELGQHEPVIGFAHNGDARAYPLRILMRHEIVNDTVGGLAVAVTYCPLCNTSIVFDRNLDGLELSFGTTGKLRKSDLVMYDRQTESWWQQYSGRAIVGALNGKVLSARPSRLLSLTEFRRQYPDGKILIPPVHGADIYNNPYENYDTRGRPLGFFDGDLPDNIRPMARVVAVGDRAWSLDYVRNQRRIEVDDLVLSWTAGQNSALDERNISRGEDVGNVVVQRMTDSGPQDVVYFVTFAFAFHAFHPESRIVTD